MEALLSPEDPPHKVYVVTPLYIVLSKFPIADVINGLSTERSVIEIV